MRRELVSKWMSREVVTVSPQTTIAEVDRLMTDHRIRRLVVVEKERVVGIITRGDVRSVKPIPAVRLTEMEIKRRLSQLKVNEVMTLDPVTIAPEATIDEAAWVMLESKFSGLPVVDDKRQLIGIITESDIFRLVVREWGKDTGRYIEWIKDETRMSHA